MKHLMLLTLYLAYCSVTHAQQKSKINGPLYSRQNLVAWCIIPYDSKKRNAVERADMLNRLGITKFAYDWRAGDLPLMEEELATMKKHGIEVVSVWFWVNSLKEGKLDESCETILRKLSATGTRTNLWVSFPENFFEGSEKEKLAKAVEAVRYIHKRAAETGSTISLYNHGAWFGEPANQVSVIEATGIKDIGIVYNFHHGHHQIGELADILRVAGPYLNTINLNGMKAEGPKILTLGEGDQELSMMEKIKASGFRGYIGIIGHTDNEDVELVLKRNLEGMKKLLRKMNDRKALRTYEQRK